MAMKSYRFALVPRKQSLYRDRKKPVEHFLRVLLKKVGAHIQRLEETGRYVYIRVLMPEEIDAQKTIAWVKRESTAALYARLKRSGCDVMYGTREDRLDFWSPDHYMDTGEDERGRGPMETFVSDALLSKRQRNQMAAYSRRRAAAI